MAHIAPDPQPQTLTLAEKIGTYGKAVAGAVVAGLTAYITAIDDNDITPSEWVAVALSFLAAFGVIWAIPQTPKWLATYGKMLFAGLAAAGAALLTGLVDGVLTQPEIITAVVAFLVGTGLTGVVSNAASSDPVDPDTGHLVPIPAAVKDAMVDGTSTEVVQAGEVITLAPSNAGEYLPVTDPGLPPPPPASTLDPEDPQHGRQPS